MIKVVKQVLCNYIKDRLNENHKQNESILVNEDNEN